MAERPHFRVAGIPVRVDPTFILIAVFLGWGAREGILLFAWVAIVGLSILIHELGHGLAFRRFGQQPSIVLQGLGGATTGSAPLTPGKDVVVSLAGPLTALLLIGVPAFLLDRADVVTSPDWRTVLSDIVFVNVVWSVANLLPILPLDGGRVTAAVLRQVKGEDGLKVACLVSAVVAAAMAVLAYQADYPFGALFAGFFCAFNLSQFSTLRKDEARRPLVEGYRALLGGDHRTALGVADEALAQHRDPEVDAAALDLQAWARLTGPEGARGETGAEGSLEARPERGKPSPLLTGAVAVAAGRGEEGVGVLAEEYRRDGVGPFGPIVARVLSDAQAADDVAAALLQNVDDGSGEDEVHDGHRSQRTGVKGLEILVSDLHHAGRFADSARLGQRLFHAGPADPAKVAYNVACSLARQRQVTEAAEWLGRASEAGFDDVELIDSDTDLDNLRATTEFRQWRTALDDASPTAAETAAEAER